MVKNYTLFASFVICLVVNVLALAAAVVVVYLAPSDMSKLLAAFIADVVATLVVFLFSVIFKNSSLYDPYWSVAPPFIAYYWMCSFLPVNNIPVIFCMAAILFWAIRLT